MRKKTFSCLSVYLTAMVFLVSTSACAKLSTKTSNVIPEPSGNYYLFNPDTILTDLAQGKKNLFIEKDENFDPPLSEPLKVVQWSQEDYFQIARAVHEFFWNETADDWKLSLLDFAMDCQYINQGPQKAAFGLYKFTNPIFRNSGIEEFIAIVPATNSIWRSNKRLGLTTMPSTAIDSSRLKVTANDAFRIAEDHGGERTRHYVENRCQVSASLAPSGLFKDWSVVYRNNNLDEIFTLLINPYTGTIK